ncbi:hypothetical protein AVEN_20448-1 [Araneus ventricosus]|uniref:Uncharacterized protein n=1 Tax=Araneus ventricosus TaxID=182803 RepID=A0A4Y2TJ80_ARAVE|nr:hypothetical protein AVEN_20448-1 [Araneus ventricosus]
MGSQSRRPTRVPLLTALQDSWCELNPGYLQTPVEYMPRRFASLLRARGGPNRILRRFTSFFGTSVYFDNLIKLITKTPLTLRYATFLAVNASKQYQGMKEGN